MTEEIEDHVHKLAQGFSIKDMEKYVRCTICDKKWSKTEVERLLTVIDRIQERVERVLEGEDWNILDYILEAIGGDR
jgi:nucleoside-triphosphatase THEP1